MKSWCIYSLLFVFLIGCHNKIETGQTLKQQDVNFIRKLMLLDDGEEILRFYSEFKIKVAGNFFTGKRMAKYWIDEKDKSKEEINSAYYFEIKSIDTFYYAGPTNSPYMLVTKTDGSQFKVCVDGKRNQTKDFFEEAIGLWKKEKNHHSHNFAQKKTEKPSWADTTYTFVNLQDTLGNKKIVVVDIGQKATIYLDAKSLRKNAIQNSSDYNKKELAKIINLLNKSSLKRDTIIIDQYMKGFDYLVSEQLQNGNAKVFYKKLNSFVPIISHRLEKYGMYAHRFFYLPDQRLFFSVMELSGIIEDNKYLSDPKELVKLGEKLASVGKE
jgi:hypothetical protein